MIPDSLRTGIEFGEVVVEAVKPFKESAEPADETTHSSPLNSSCLLFFGLIQIVPFSGSSGLASVEIV